MPTRLGYAHVSLVHSVDETQVHGTVGMDPLIAVEMLPVPARIRGSGWERQTQA